MKPEFMTKSDIALAEKRRDNYYKRMRKNRWYKKGWKAGKKKLSKTENPYTLSEEIMTLLKKRTYWEMGHDEATYTPSTKKLERETKLKHKSKKHESKH